MRGIYKAVIAYNVEMLGEIEKQKFNNMQNNTTTDAKLPVISRFYVHEILELIKEQTGLKFELCDYFTGIKEHNGRKYFNIILHQRTSESKEYDTLKRFADKYKMISVEPNGLNRVAVFQNVL